MSARKVQPSDQKPHKRTARPEQENTAPRHYQQGGRPHQRQTVSANRTAKAAHTPTGNRISARKRRPRVAPYLVAVLVFAALVVSAILNPPVYAVTVNGSRRFVLRGTTIQKLLDGKVASPTPGDLLAVDGSVIKQGGGDPFVATVDGRQTTDPGTRLGVDAQVQIDDGDDVTEEYDERTEKVPYSIDGDYETLSSYYNGAFHILSQGADGEQLVRTGKVSGKSVATVTKEPVDATYTVCNADVGGQKLIALTFDDGPWDTTPELLDVLKKNGAHATFFTVGKQVDKYPDTVKREHEEGHQVCTHTWDHAAGSGQGVNLTYMSAEEQTDELEKGFEAVDSALGTEVTRIFRAPGGNYYGSAVSNLGGRVVAEVGWDVDTEDWRRPGVDSLVKTLEKAKPGQVILMHDGGGDRTQTIKALSKALPELRKQGYQFVTIDELIAADQGTLSATIGSAD